VDARPEVQPLRVIRQWRIMEPMARPWIAVFETAAYLARAAKLLTEDEQAAVVEMIARDPTCGVLIQGTGGVRKVRVGLGGRGKSGGARVIYFFHDETIPVFLFSVFAKNEKANLSRAELNALARLTEVIKRGYRR
jgi:hypothetical protein